MQIGYCLLRLHHLYDNRADAGATSTTLSISPGIIYGDMFRHHRCCGDESPTLVASAFTHTTMSAPADDKMGMIRCAFWHTARRLKARHAR